MEFFPLLMLLSMTLYGSAHDTDFWFLLQLRDACANDMLLGYL